MSDQVASTAQNAQNATTGTIPAAWYPDPQDPAAQRWWDGARWTEHTAPGPAAAPPGAQHAAGEQYAAGDPQAAGPQWAEEPARPARGMPLTRKRRISWWIAIPIIALVLVASVNGVLYAIKGATGPGGPQVDKEVTAAVPASWQPQPILDGAGAVAIDPAWEDLGALFGGDAMAEQITAMSGIPTVMEGMWMTSGDIATGGGTLMVMSTTESGAPGEARTVAEGFMNGAAASYSDEVRTFEGYVGLPSGVTAYLIEFDAISQGIALDCAVATIVSPSGSLIVQSIGATELSSGDAELESFLASIEID